MQFYTSCPSSSFASQQEVLTLQQLWLVVLRLPLQTFCSVAWDFISAAGLTLMLSTFSAVLYGVVIWKWGSRREVIFFIQIDKKAHIGELGDLILWLKNLLTEKMQHRFRVKCPCTVPQTRHLWTPWEGSMHCSQIERPCSAMLEPTIFFFLFSFFFLILLLFGHQFEELVFKPSALWPFWSFVAKSPILLASQLWA